MSAYDRFYWKFERQGREWGDAPTETGFAVTCTRCGAGATFRSADYPDNQNRDKAMLLEEHGMTLCEARDTK